MVDSLKLKKEVSRTTMDIEPDDVLSVKEKLKKFGYYKEPEYGITKFSDNQMFDGIKKFQEDNKLKADAVMKPEGETENTFNKLLKKGEYASSAAQQGLSLGWADEAEGVMGGLGYGLGSLNKDWNKKGESFSQAYNRGYEKYRDERRNVLSEGYQKEPVLTAGSEIAGSIANPIKFTGISSKAPLHIMNRKNLLDSLANSGVYGMGASKDDTKDYVKNIATGGIGGTAGHIAGNILLGRGRAHPLMRKSVGAAIGFATQSAYNKLEKK